MGSIFRSEPMCLCQLLIEADAAYFCVAELGELGLVQFKNLNEDVNAFSRRYAKEVAKCDELEQKLNALELKVRSEGIRIPKTSSRAPVAPAPQELEAMVGIFDRLAAEQKEVEENAATLKVQYIELHELLDVLSAAEEILPYEECDGRDYLVGQGSLSFLAGVVHTERAAAFERMVWRVCRGNAFVKTHNISTDCPVMPSIEGVVDADEADRKTVFVVYFFGEQMKLRVKKVAEGFRAKIYPVPENALEREQTLTGVKHRIEDLVTVISQTHIHRQTVLQAAAKTLRTWRSKTMKTKAIYHALNGFRSNVASTALIAECWVPRDDVKIVQDVLRTGMEKSGSRVPPILNCICSNELPPTYFKRHCITDAFQDMIDSFGVASYRELNPMPFSVATVPFLFAIMFGDVGHGLILMLIACYFIYIANRKGRPKKSDEMWHFAFLGRFVMFFMAVFSIFTGLIYNDVFSKSVNLFGSSWSMENFRLREIHGNSRIQVDPAMTYAGDPYPFGMDPVWQMASNRVAYLNSFKMKTSIIFGFCHMLLGILLRLCNCMFFKSYMDIYCAVIPQLFFLCSLFGYLVFMIFKKWTAYTSEDSACAPSILMMFIDMMLMKDESRHEDCDEPYLFSGQLMMQHFLLFVALLCIPWLLFMKSVLTLPKQVCQEELMIKEHDDYKKTDIEAQKDSKNDEDGGVRIQEPDSGVVEKFIEGTIHGIEFCLGTVSHIASYLRLWALSLAHAQLSEVLWKMVLSVGLRASFNGNNMFYSGFLVAAAFFLWAVFTLALLVCMEGLSAYLHTLRLHWVEFMSKFYDGQGHPFMPFCFNTMARLAEG